MGETADKMNFYRVFFRESHWLTVVVRARDEAAAARLGQEVVVKYLPADAVDGVELLDPNGPEEVVVVDDS